MDVDGCNSSYRGPGAAWGSVVLSNPLIPCFYTTYFADYRLYKRSSKTSSRGKTGSGDTESSQPTPQVQPDPEYETVIVDLEMTTSLVHTLKKTKTLVDFIKLLKLNCVFLNLSFPNISVIST
jgi:hypothetical protein